MKYGDEAPLYYPDSHAGTSDLCGVYNNEESIIDFKSSSRLKKRMDKGLFSSNMCICTSSQLTT